MPERQEVELDTYKEEVTEWLSSTWKLAQEHVHKAQKKQKQLYDHHARDPGFHIGNRVFGGSLQICQAI